MSRCFPWFLFALILGLCPGARADDGLTPLETLKEAIRSSPRVVAAEARLKGLREWSRGVGAQPNPELRLSATSGDAEEQSNSLVQTLEVFGQPGLRRSYGNALAEASHQELLEARLHAAVTAATAYYDLWEAQQEALVMIDRDAIAQRLLEVSARRLELGEISTSQHLRVELEAASARADRTRAEADEFAAEALLRGLLGRHEPLPPLPVLEEGRAPDLALTPDSESLDALLLQTEQNLPELVGARHRLDAAWLQTRLAGRENAPNIELSAYRSRLFAREAEQGLQLSLVVPLWDWGQSGAEVARLDGEAAALEHELQALVIETRYRVMQAWYRYQAAVQRRSQLEQQVSAFRRLSEMATRGYDAGLLSLPEVLETQRAFRQGRLEYVAAEAELQRSRIELHAASGDLLAQEEMEK
ncbi:MAG: TolC family protein [Armatimonadetes bacterium]|nr:TolC family protein [Armatimonadota bacterium]